MARSSQVVSAGICRVVWLEVEEDDTEFLYVPGVKFYWPQAVGLYEGDQFLQFILNLDAVHLEEALFRGDAKVLDKLWKLYRETQGYVDPQDVMDQVNELQRSVNLLLKAIGAVVQDDLEAELDELRAEKGIQM